MKTWLVDTGPLVAYLDERDPWHDRVSVVFDSDPAVLWTTMPIITETMYFLRTAVEACSEFVGFLRDAHMKVEAFSSLDELNRAAVLMKKYRDVPMDFADASLVVLAEKIGVRDILTIDRRGFRAFRVHGRQAFHLVLDDFPG